MKASMRVRKVTVSPSKLKTPYKLWVLIYLKMMPLQLLTTLSQIRGKSLDFLEKPLARRARIDEKRKILDDLFTFLGKYFDLE